MNKKRLNLSNREKEILGLLAEGKSSMEISKILIIGFETVKTHRVNLYRKLKVTKKSDCLSKAKQLDLL